MFKQRNQLKSYLIYLVLATLFTTTLGGCLQVRKKLDLETKAEIDFFAASDVNPNTEGRPSPVVVKLFKLADSRQFKQQDFLALYENAKERLGVDLLEAVKLKEFAPNEQRIEKFKLNPDVKYIGILAEFSRYKEANATMVIPVESYKTNSYRIKISHLNVRLQEAHEYQQKEKKPKESRYKSEDDWDSEF